MNGFDLALVAVVGLSALFAFVRGVIREAGRARDMGHRRRRGDRLCRNAGGDAAGARCGTGGERGNRVRGDSPRGDDRRRRWSRAMLRGRRARDRPGLRRPDAGRRVRRGARAPGRRRFCADRRSHHTAQARLVAEFDSGTAAGAGCAGVEAVSAAGMGREAGFFGGGESVSARLGEHRSCAES